MEEILTHHIDTKKTEIFLSYLLDLLLNARIKTNLETNTFANDEDVNMYLVGLLRVYANPVNLQEREKYLSNYDSEVSQKVNKRDTLHNFLLYKYNADNYFIFLSIFNGIKKTVRNALFQIDNEVYLGRTKAYYHYAAEFSRRLSHNQATIGEILEKLAVKLEAYIRIMQYIQNNYFIFEKKFSEGEWFHLNRQIVEKSNPIVYQTLLDEFLKTYQDWTDHHSEESKKKLDQLTEHLRAINPKFKFSL